MSDLLRKNGDWKFPDDGWREILHANGFTPSGTREEVWRSSHSDLKIKIDVDRDTEEPYYQVITEDGSRSAKWSDTEALKSIVEPNEEEPPQLGLEEAEEQDAKFLKDVGIVGRWRNAGKLAGRPPRFSFTVPMKAAGPIAFHLAKAGMKDFDVSHYEEGESSVFEFPTEPEMHVAEEIVKAEFADQIKARKGLWGMWAETHDPSQVKSEQELHPPKQYLSSVEEKKPYEATDEDLPEGFFGEEPFEQQRRRETDPTWEPDYKKLPKSALLACNLKGWPTWEPSAKTAMTEADAQRMNIYRRKKLLAWIEELGLDLSAELKNFDEGDFQVKDRVYEEVRDMIKEERKDQTAYRRVMRGRP